MSSWQGIRNSFVAGIVLLTPLLLTLYILRILVNFLLQFINPVVQNTNLSSYTANVEIVAQALALVIILLTIAGIGYLAERRIGERLFGSLGKLVALIPLFRTIYGTVKQLSNSVSNSETSYDSLVMIQYPRKGVYSFGLVTNDSPSAVNEAAGTKMKNVFVPSSPNPASGRLVLVPESQLRRVDLSARDGIRMLMTTGVNEDKRSELLPDEFQAPTDTEERARANEQAPTDSLTDTDEKNRES